MSVIRRAIPAAAGYPQYSGNLIHPIVGQELIERFYATSVFGDISTTEYIGELAKGGDQITFFREPTVTIRDATKSGTIVHDTLESEPVTVVIDRAKEFSVKIAKIDIKQMMMWETFKAALLKNAARTMANNIDGEILGSVYADVHLTNQGATAGVISSGYNLGATGAPRDVDSTNVLGVLTDMHAVLNEAQIPKENRWIVVPTQFEVAIMNSDLKAAYFSGLGQSTYLNGKIPNKIANFDIYVSDHVSRVFDSSANKFAYHILGGHRSSICFASQLEETRVIEDKDSWDEFYQGLQVFGFDVVQRTALTHLYASVSN